MRLGVAMVLVGLTTLPLSVRAQSEDAIPEPDLKEPAAPSEPGSEQPALKLDDARVKVTPTRDGSYIVEPTGVESDVRKPAPPSESGPWLRLELDSAGLHITPTAERFYVVEPTGGQEMPRRKRIGIGVGVAFGVLGVVALGVGVAFSRKEGFGDVTSQQNRALSLARPMQLPNGAY